jgi:cysteine desulfurase / selenocysteine lyase
MFSKLRKDFPFFTAHPQVIYLDNAATTHKPQEVIDAVTRFYSYDNAPVHRGIYTLAEQATIHYEQARDTVAKFIGASSQEVIFTKGTTESINFVAYSWAQAHLQSGDQIIITELEHHANILPWMRLAQQKDLILNYVPLNEQGLLDYQAYNALLSSATKLVAFSAGSNVISTPIDIEYIAQCAKKYGAKVLIDGAQIVGRQQINLTALDIDFFAFSGHKMLGPTGIGVLYINKRLHKEIEPYQVGGGMVFNVNHDSATWLKPPHKYEAGTPPIAQALGLAAAVRYLERAIDFKKVYEYESALTSYASTELEKIPTISILPSQKNGHLVSFFSSKYHAHDIAAYLDIFGICVRAGNHCTQILHKKMGIESSVRLSFYFYTTQEEVETCIKHIKKLCIT